MKKTHTSRSAFYNLHLLISFAFCALGVLLALLAFAFYSGATAHAQTPQQNLMAGQLTPEDAQKLAEGLKPLINESTKGLVPVQRADGSVSMDLQGRFQNVTVAKKEADGSVSQSCVNNLDAAAAFFGIDRQLLGPVSKTQPPEPKDR